MEALKRKFKPEFLNRIDVITMFKSLTQEQITLITRKMLDVVAARLKEQGVVIRFTDAVVNHMAAVGYDAVYGARPLRRAIEQSIENALAEKLLAGENEGHAALVCDAENNEVVFLYE
jgi:ATP-dependent Clp protease ATP-binding subunit ClpA